MSNSPPCLVLGSGVTALGTLRCLGRVGIDARLVSASPGVAGRSRWYRPAPRSAADVPDSPSLAEYLTGLDLESAVLVSASDNYARAVARLPSDLRARFPASTASAEVLDLLVDKAGFARLLDEQEIPAPRTVLLDEEGAMDLFRDPEATFFLKPTDSQKFFAIFGVKAFMVTGLADLRDRVRQASEAGVTLLAQEYVPGPASAHIFIDGFVDRDETVTGLLVRRRLRMDPPDFGNSSFMVTIAPEEAEGAVAAIRRLLSAVRYRGIFSAEFKQDPRDGAFRILEVNARSWWYVEFAARCGMNAPQMAYNDALGREVQPSRGYRIGARFVYPEFDLGAYRVLRQRGELTFWPWIRSWIGAQQPILCLDDPVPGLQLLWEFMKRRLPGGRSVGRERSS